MTTIRPTSRLTQALWDRFGGLVRELSKFGTVGACTYVVDTVIFNVFRDSAGTFWSKVISTIISTTLAFIGNRYWTWRDRERSGLHREYLLYIVFNVVGLGIAEICLWISNGMLGHFWPRIFRTRLADNVSAQVVGTAFGTLFRFWSYRRYIFQPTAPALEAESPAVVDGTPARG